MAATLLPGMIPQGGAGDEPEEEEQPELEATVDPADLYQRPKPPPPEWIEQVLAAHNEKRSRHWTPPLIWSELCYEYAKRQADTCSSKNKLKHGLNDTIQGRLGQCLLGPEKGPWKMTRKNCATIMVDQWYKEIEHYTFDHPRHHSESANFEQVIWFATTSVGVAISKCGRFVVANYFPAGPDHSQAEPCGEKGRRLYFPPGHEVNSMTNSDKYHAWFRTNVLPLKDGPAPWLGGTRRHEAEAPSHTDEEKANENGSRSREGSPKASGKKKGVKKGQSTKSLGGKSSRASSRSPSRSATRKMSPSAGERKTVDVKLMTPPAKKSTSAGSLRDKRATSRERKQQA